ncbi:MAG TPA: CvpA family protein [Candidatus Omnitrophica bacterium]|nr:CvpA family protein [Candidatus Omnitrophota bacterium]
MGFGDLMSQLNWIDVLIITLLFRSTYIGAKQGVIVEIFKLLSFISISFFTLHYYAVWGDFLNNATPLDKSASYVFCYLLITSVLLFIFKFARHSFLRIVKIEVIEFLSFWGGVLFGFIRGFLVSSLICLFFFVFTGDYLKGSVRQSFSGGRVLKISPVVYKSIYNGLIIKFNPNSELNEELFDSLEG